MLFLRACLFVALALAASGCARPARDTRPRILIWHQKIPSERVVFDAVLADYNAAHPDRQVEALYRENEELRNLFILAATAGQGPDLIYGPCDNVGVYCVTGTIQPLDDIIPPAQREAFIPEAFVEYHGRHWMLADQIGSHLMLVCDRAQVPEPPQTTDELIAVAQRLTRRGQAEAGRDFYGLTWNYREPFFFIPFLTAFGGWVMDGEGKPTLANEATVQALEFILALRDRHGVIPREGDLELADALFRDGRAAMVINGPWAWGKYDLGSRARLAPLPVHSQTGRPLTPMVSLCGYSISTKVAPERLGLVREVLEHLTSATVQQRFARELLLAPTRKAVRESPEVRGNEILQQSLAQVARSRPIPIRPEMRQIWDGMRGPYQLVMSGTVDAKTGAQLMQEECERLIRDARLE